MSSSHPLDRRAASYAQHSRQWGTSKLDLVEVRPSLSPDKAEQPLAPRALAFSRNSSISV